MAEQTYLPGTEPPDRNVDIERAIATWLEKKITQKRAAADTKQAHGAVVLQIQHAGLEAYPWTNPDTGKKRRFAIVREPKVHETNVPSERAIRRGRNADVGDATEKRERKRRREEEKVEVRRVPRSTVEDEVDPFAATRNALASSSSSAKTKHDKPKAKKKR